MESKEDLFSPDQIRQTAASFQQSRILLTAVELNLFTVIDNHLMTSKEVADKIGADERATDRLMNALTAYGFLRKTKNKFYNEQHSKDYLVEGKPGYMNGLQHTANLWHNWTTLTDAVKKGSCVKDVPGERDERHWESFIAAMHYRGMKQAKILSYMLDLSNVKTVLDIGGGSGAFSMGFVHANSAIKATLFDLPPVIPIAKRYVEEAGLTENFIFIEGDYHRDEFPGKYDLIFLSAIVHINSFEENKRLIKKCADSMINGGQIIIQDFVMDESRVNPPAGTLFALNMLVGTESGDTYTEAEIKSWLGDAGINNCERKDTGFGTALIIGKK